MLKAEELRIVNYVSIDNSESIFIVASITNEDFKSASRFNENDLVLQDIFDNSFVEIDISNEDEQRVFGIPLTEEWLLKFSAEKLEDNGGVYYALQIGNNLNLTISLKDEITGIDLNWRAQGSQLWAQVKSVHQLQNLYYALTGEELCLKD